MAINKNVFIHEADRAALQALESIPGFRQVLKAFMSVWNEKIMYIQNMSSYVRLSENQLSKYYKMLPPICDKLGIDIPDLFLKLDPYPNAGTSGDTKPYIVMTSGLIETVPEELIPTVLAHECGHIACHHVLYRTMGSMILSGAMNYVLPADIAKYVELPIQSAFAYWMRCSEFSADRAAILCDGTPDRLIEMCARFAGFDKDIPETINLEEFMKQAEDYKELVGHNVLNKGIEFLSFGFNDHPINAVRAFEAQNWAKSENFIKSKAYFDSYMNDEKPQEVPIEWNERHFLGRNYLDVDREIREFGFVNVESVRNVEKNILTKEGSVTKVTLAGETKYKDAEWYPIDVPIEVTYYLPLTEEEIIALHPGEVRVPNNSKYYIGKKAGVTKQELENLGFYNVIVEPIKDINKGSDKKLGTISMITINKASVFTAGDWVSLGAEIKIYSHALLSE